MPEKQIAIRRATADDSRAFHEIVSRALRERQCQGLSGVCDRLPRIRAWTISSPSKISLLLTRHHITTSRPPVEIAVDSALVANEPARGS